MIKLLYLFIKVTFLAVFMTSITPLKRSDKKSYSLIVVGNIFIWLLNFLIFAIKGDAFMERIFFLTAILPAFIFFSAIAEYKGFKLLFSLLTVCIFSTMSGYIGFLSMLILYNDAVAAIFNSLCYILLIVYIFKVFRKPYFQMLETLETGWGLFCSVPLLLLLIVFLLQYYPTPILSRPQNGPLLLLVYILMFAFYAIVYLNFENITQYYQLKQDKKLMLLQTEMQKKVYEATLDKINATRIYRHDIRHHINALNAILNANSISDAKKYLGKLSNYMDSTSIERYCENYVINIIFSAYINRAQKEKIEVSCKADVPDGLKIDDPDLWAIFSNAFENSIMACRMIESHSNRKIMIDCKEHCTQLYIQISNTFAGEVMFDGEYPVSQREGHGFGTRSIAAIVEKYGGVFSFTAENGFFTTTVILNSYG